MKSVAVLFRFRDSYVSCCEALLFVYYVTCRIEVEILAKMDTDFLLGLFRSCASCLLLSIELLVADALNLWTASPLIQRNRDDHMKSYVC